MGNYPQLVCGAHGEQRSGYAICIHVAKKEEDISHFEPCTNKKLGVICCAACHPHYDDHEYILSNFMTICEACAKDQGYTSGPC